MIDPSVSPKQEIFVWTGFVSNIGASMISIFTTSSQSCASITVTSYIPADKLVCVGPLPKLLQNIWYGSTPPWISSVIVPSSDS